ncbi:hypothetical protein PMAYCL1PPCAC_26933 [Pristionchus mayeri]|uniref:Ionotropic glutamate receptor L-glutamate and glycine-binding domain-containing protein n=1 Tax=Pristionchus mayeri TaxID=1317129 RepID=A0AAN5D566_9BILA|nr:hypothetical protein PMAYCL1PPCAC_26933 [Pristionchus mayeri]
MRPSLLHLLLSFAPIYNALRFGTFEVTPFVMLKRECWDPTRSQNKSECSENNRYEGRCIDLMHLIAKEMDANYTVQIMNQPWEKKVDDLESSRVDAIVASLIADQERAALVDFSQPFHTSGISMIALKSRRPIKRRLLNPHSSVTWGVLIVLETLGATGCYVLYIYLTGGQRTQRCLIFLLCLLVWIGCSFALVSSTLHHAYEAHSFNTKHEVKLFSRREWGRKSLAAVHNHL